MAANMQSLAARLGCGEESAFAELYDVCAHRLHHYLTVLLGGEDRAADVLQAAFLRAVQNRKRFSSVENPIAYIFQMARNEAVRAAKQTRRQQAQWLKTEPKQRASENSNPSDDAELAAVSLAQLNVEEREIVELKIFAGLTFAEIADVTGQPAATVATRYRRALESLRPWLERQFR